MVINYVYEDPKAELQFAHTYTMRLLLEETLGTFNGFFFVAIYTNAAIQ